MATFSLRFPIGSNNSKVLIFKNLKEFEIKRPLQMTCFFHLDILHGTYNIYIDSKYLVMLEMKKNLSKNKIKGKEV